MSFDQRPFKWACVTIGCINNLGGLKEPAEEITVDLDFASGLCTIDKDGSCRIEFKE